MPVIPFTKSGQPDTKAMGPTASPQFLLMAAAQMSREAEAKSTPEVKPIRG